MKTSYYASDKGNAPGLVPIRISRGSARFGKCKPRLAIPELAPEAVDDLEECRRLYLAQLTALGVARIRDLIQIQTAFAGNGEPVLMCFERVDGPAAKPCHRRWFAEWWQAATGEEVAEL